MIIAVFDVDEEKLEESMGGSVGDSLSCCDEHGLFLVDYENLNDFTKINLKDLLRSHEEVRIKTIEEFKKRLSDICDTQPIGVDQKNFRPLYAHEDESGNMRWYDLIADVAEELKNKTSEQEQEQAQTQAFIKM